MKKYILIGLLVVLVLISGCDKECNIIKKTEKFTINSSITTSGFYNDSLDIIGELDIKRPTYKENGMVLFKKEDCTFWHDCDSFMFYLIPNCWFEITSPLFCLNNEGIGYNRPFISKEKYHPSKIYNLGNKTKTILLEWEEKNCGNSNS